MSITDYFVNNNSTVQLQNSTNKKKLKRTVIMFVILFENIYRHVRQCELVLVAL